MYNEQTGKPGSHSEKIHICQQIKTAVSQRRLFFMLSQRKT